MFDLNKLENWTVEELESYKSKLVLQLENWQKQLEKLQEQKKVEPKTDTKGLPDLVLAKTKTLQLIDEELSQRSR